MASMSARDRRPVDQLVVGRRLGRPVLKGADWWIYQRMPTSARNQSLRSEGTAHLAGLQLRPVRADPLVLLAVALGLPPVVGVDLVGRCGFIDALPPGIGRVAV